jgi:hypothetical protein
MKNTYELFTSDKIPDCCGSCKYCKIGLYRNYLCIRFMKSNICIWAKCDGYIRHFMYE